jgi:hypothetical protein
MIYIISGIKKTFSRRLRGFAQKAPEINSAVICDISGIKKTFSRGLQSFTLKVLEPFFPQW